MTLMDPIGDMFTRIRNGQLRLLTKVEMPSSNFRLSLVTI
jgi:ribosomal protein S8